MSMAFNWFDNVDLAGLVVAMLIVAVAVLAWLVHVARREAASQQRQAEENWCWAELHRQEADAVRKRLHVMERRYATLQSLYADLVRQRLADNFVIIKRNAARQRRC